MIQLSNSWKVTLATLIPALLSLISQVFNVSIPAGVSEMLLVLFGITAAAGTANSIAKRKSLPADTGRLRQVNKWLKANLVTVSGEHIFTHGDPVLTAMVTDTGNYAGLTLKDSTGKVIGIAQEDANGVAKLTMYRDRGTHYEPFSTGKYTLSSVGNRSIDFVIR